MSSPAPESHPPITRAELAAGRKTLDERAVRLCAQRDQGCQLIPYGKHDGPTPIGTLHALPEGAGSVYACAKHQPSQRHAWVLDVPIERHLAYAHSLGTQGAYPIDDLKRFLPLRHWAR
jgi:hypothetical protein